MEKYIALILMCLLDLSLHLLVAPSTTYEDALQGCQFDQTCEFSCDFVVLTTYHKVEVHAFSEIVPFDPLYLKSLQVDELCCDRRSYERSFNTSALPQVILLASLQ